MKEITVKAAAFTQEGEELVHDYLEFLRDEFMYQDNHLEDIKTYIEDTVYHKKQNLWYGWDIQVDFEYMDSDPDEWRELDQEVFNIPAKFFTMTLQIKENE